MSLKFVMAMATAIPTVKPTMMEFGTSLAYLPTPNMPMTISTTPDMMDTSTRKPCAVSNCPPPAGPYFAMCAAMTGMNAAVGPYTWYFEPPKVLPTRQATAPAMMPCSGRIPMAIAKPIAIGMAVRATMRPALKSW